MKKYAIAGKSAQNLNKKFNGDFYKFTVFDGYILLALADGVGSRPCDNVAAQMSCDLFIEKCSAALKKTDDLKDIIADAIAEIDSELYKQEGKCKGMLSCFSAAIWPVEKDHLSYINIGDTRIFHNTHKNNTLQISVDESVDVTVKDRKGNVKLFDSGTEARSLISYALGIGNTQIRIEHLDFSKADMLLMSSDGFYNCSPEAIEDIVQKCRRYEDLGIGVDKSFSLLSDGFKDDATVLVLRRNDFEPVQIDFNQLHLLNSEGEQSMPDNVMLTVLMDNIETNLHVFNAENCLKRIACINERSLFPSQKSIDNLLRLYLLKGIEHPGIYDGLVRILQQSVR